MLILLPRCEGTLKPLNQKFAGYANHPCRYLGDPDYGPVDITNRLSSNSTAVRWSAEQAHRSVQQRQGSRHKTHEQ
jgi:hypothetical protein